MMTKSTQYRKIPTFKSFETLSANSLNSFRLSLVGLPSVNTIMTFGLSGLSPPSLLNNSSLAIFKARSVRVSYSNSRGSSAILFNRASLSWNSARAKLNSIIALLWNVIKPKWSAAGAGLNFLMRFFKNSMTIFRFFIFTLFDLSRTIPISSPATHGGAV